jgi:Ice-binding-like
MNLMNNRQIYLFTCFLATAALLGGVSSASAQVPLGSAANFAILGGTNVTCTGGAVLGDIGVSPGSAVSYTNTGCAVAGATPPATNAGAAEARTDFLGAYAELEILAATYACTEVDGSLAALNLAPGVYCTDAVAKTGVLTLNGPSNGVWTFLVDGALTGTNFSVVMAGGGQACNVYWAPKVAATFTTSTVNGTILAGDATGGSITLTGGTLTGSALANVAVTTTGTTVIGCQVATGPTPLSLRHTSNR